MERALIPGERESAMFLLKTMVLMCMVCVFITLYTEYRRMSKFEKLLGSLKGSSWSRDRMRSSLSSSFSAEEHTDTDGHTPKP